MAKTTPIDTERGIASERRQNIPALAAMFTALALSKRIDGCSKDSLVCAAAANFAHAARMRGRIEMAGLA